VARTWGQLRLLVQKAHPGYDLDLLDGYLNAAYEAILDSREWRGLDAAALLSSVALYETGTISLTNGSTAVALTDGTFLSTMTSRRLRIAGRNEIYTFSFLTGTTGTLDRGYEGDTASGLSYKIFRNVFELPETVKYVTEIGDPQTGRKLKKRTQAEMNDMSPARVEYGPPRYWAPADDTAEGAPAIYHRVELYPIPTTAQTFPYRFQKAAQGFSGSNTDSSPMPWVSSNAVLFKIRALILLDEKNFSGAEGWKALADEETARLHLVESQRQGPQAIPMAERFTRHYRTRGLT
jgi:hypothetical protein